MRPIPVSSPVTEMARLLRAQIAYQAQMASINFILTDEFLFWLSDHLVRAKFVPQQVLGTKVLTHQPDTWNTNAKPATHVAVVQLLPANPRMVTAWSGLVTWAHATTEGGLQGILASRRMEPTLPFMSDQTPFTAFMCLAAHMHGNEESDDASVARIIARALQHGKNRCNVILVGAAQGRNTPIDSGGSWEGLHLANTEGTVHIRKEKIWAIKCDAACLTGIAFASGSLPGLA